MSRVLCCGVEAVPRSCTGRPENFAVRTKMGCLAENGHGMAFLVNTGAARGHVLHINHAAHGNA